MKIRPLNDWVVIRASEPQERTAAGIIIPEVAKEKPQWGFVEAVGPGSYETEDKKDKDKKKFVPTVVKKGDRVLYEKYMAKEFGTGADKIIMVRERSVLGIFGSEDTALQKIQPSELAKKEAGALEPVKKSPKKKNK